MERMLLEEDGRKRGRPRRYGDAEGDGEGSGAEDRRGVGALGSEGGELLEEACEGIGRQWGCSRCGEGGEGRVWSGVWVRLSGG